MSSYHNVKDVMEAGRRADSYCEALGLSRGEYHGGESHPPMKVMVIRDIEMTTR